VGKITPRRNTGAPTKSWGQKKIEIVQNAKCGQKKSVAKRRRKTLGSMKPKKNEGGTKEQEFSVRNGLDELQSQKGDKHKRMCTGPDTSKKIETSSKQKKTEGVQ